MLSSSFTADDSLVDTERSPQFRVEDAGALSRPSLQDPRDPAEEEATGTIPVADLQAQLRREGIAHFQGSATREQFLSVAQAVGVPWAELFVYADPALPMFVRNPRPVRFHTDSVKANVIGWYCVEACRTNVPNLYLDTWDAYARLDATERAHLESLTLADPLLAAKLSGTGKPTPIVQRVDGRLQTFWLPDAIGAYVATLDPERAKTLTRFANLLAGVEGTRVVRVRLRAGQFVLVDNNRFLHGRAAIPVDSPRMLYRLWINTDGWAPARARQVTKLMPIEDAKRFDEQR